VRERECAVLVGEGGLREKGGGRLWVRSCARVVHVLEGRSPV
jgi:hypothetical protein